MRYLIFILLFFGHEGFAQEASSSQWRDDFVETVGAPEEEPVEPSEVIQGTPLPQLPVPTPRPEREPVVQRPSGERDWENGQPADFSGVSRSITTAPIWPAFTDVFSRCAPGCSPRNVGTWRPGSGRSCHHSGNAVDLGGMRCNGQNYSAYTGRFAEFVECARNSTYEGRRWRSLFRETHVGRSRDCSGQNRDQTQCHWDHVHLSFGCSTMSI